MLTEHRISGTGSALLAAHTRPSSSIILLLRWPEAETQSIMNDGSEQKRMAQANLKHGIAKPVFPGLQLDHTIETLEAHDRVACLRHMYRCNKVRARIHSTCAYTVTVTAVPLP